MPAFIRPRGHSDYETSEEEDEVALVGPRDLLLKTRFRKSPAALAKKHRAWSGRRRVKFAEKLTTTHDAARAARAQEGGRVSPHPPGDGPESPPPKYDPPSSSCDSSGTEVGGGRGAPKAQTRRL